MKQLIYVYKPTFQINYIINQLKLIYFFMNQYITKKIVPMLQHRDYQTI